MPALFQGLVSLAVLPLTTRILGPADYGTFALVAGFTMFGGSIATGSATFLISAQFVSANFDERRDLVTTVLGVTFAIGVLLAVALGVAWIAMPRSMGLADQIGDAAAYCGLLSMLLSIPWSVAYLLQIVSGDPSRYAITILTSTVVGTIATLVSLFVLQIGGLALFAGLVAGSFVQFIGAAVVLRPYMVLRFAPALALRAVRLTFFGLVSNSFDALQVLIERSMLAAYTGLHSLGLYTHAQQYRSGMFLPVKALANAVWPTTLVEAKSPALAFDVTARAWAPGYVLLAFVCIGFACVGRELIGLLTNGKFVDSTPFAVVLVILLLAQFSGRPQLGLLYARDRGEFLSVCTGLSAGAGIVALLVLVPPLGAVGAVIALYVQHFSFRLGVHWRAQEEAKTPFKDMSAVFGGALALLALAVSESIPERLDLRIAILVVFSAALAILERETLFDAVRMRESVRK